MKWWHYLLLYALGLGVMFVVSAFQSSPGYMDADYYYIVGLRIANGFGFSEPFIWNYLDNPASIPHPSNAYWMPLTSLWVAFVTKIIGTSNFKGVQAGIVALSALLPPLTASLAYSFNHRRRAGLLAGLIALFPGFYLSYLSTSDAIGIYMVLGVLFLCTAGGTSQFSQGKVYGIFFLLGILIGLMHLARADGVLWLLVACCLALCNWGRKARDLKATISIFYTSLGYVIVMGPWMARNLTAFGTLMAPGGMRTLWLTKYDQLFTYPANRLDIYHWWASGLGEILRVRLWALGQNLQTVMAVQGMIFLLPLIVVGLWHLRDHIVVRSGLLAWLVVFSTMTIIFPFTGVRGGLLHSGAALQPLFFAVVPEGLDVFLDWGVRQRGWTANHASKFFSASLVLLAIFFTVVVTKAKVVGADISEPIWDKGYRTYLRQEKVLDSLGAGEEDIVMVNNPPGYFYANGHQTIVIPYGDEADLVAVAKRYHAHFVLLDENYLGGPLSDLYTQPGEWPGLTYLQTDGDVQFYQLIQVKDYR
jgi:hypothetical protein